MRPKNGEPTLTPSQGVRPGLTSTRKVEARKNQPEPNPTESDLGSGLNDYNMNCVQDWGSLELPE